MEKNGKDKCGVELVINGGKETMDSATIPVRWFFSPEVIAQKPAYLLFFEQTKAEAKNDMSMNLGRRYVCRVDEGTKFIQLFSAGWHRLMVLVFAYEIRDELLATCSRDCYEVSIPWGDKKEEVIKDKGFSEWWRFKNNALAATIVEFVVPEALFAKPPKTAFQKMVWKFANLWHRWEPSDECEYGKRKIMMAPKLLVWLLWQSVVWLSKLLGAAYLIVASGAVLFCGWRPKPLWVGICQMARGSGIDLDVVRYGDYRVWVNPIDNHKAGGPWENKMMPIAPWEVCAVAAAALALYFLVPLVLGRPWVFIAVAVSALLVLSYIAIYAFKFIGWLARKYRVGWLYAFKERQARRREERNKRKRERDVARSAAAIAARTQRDNQYREWLGNNFNLDRKPEKVDLNHLPVPLKANRRVVQVFRVSYWALKAKKCRPYSR